jgi:cytochrome c oxidase assembly factor 5
MPRIYETEEDVKTDGRSCGDIRDDLRYCLLQTDCVQKERKTMKECLLSQHHSVPEECHNLRYLLFECKRSLLDNRQRFRGRKGY